MKDDKKELHKNMLRQEIGNVIRRYESLYAVDIIDVEYDPQTRELILVEERV